MNELPVTKSLELNKSGEWLYIWFNRPEKRNALAKEMTDELMDVFAAIKNDRSIRGVSLRGRGGVFCAGGDLKALGDMATQTHHTAHNNAIAASLDGANLFRALHELPQFTLAVVEGAAMAGGMGLASAADVTIAEENAKFALTETRIGLIPAQIAPYLISVGGYPDIYGKILSTYIGDQKSSLSNNWHDFALVYYPSRTSFLRLMTNTPQGAAEIRREGLKKASDALPDLG